MVESNEKISFYPNPFLNELNIDNVSNYNNVSISDLSGKIIFKEKVLNTNIKLNLSQLQSGTYILILQSDKADKRILITKF